MKLIGTFLSHNLAAATCCPKHLHKLIFVGVVSYKYMASAMKIPNTADTAYLFVYTFIIGLFCNIWVSRICSTCSRRRSKQVVFPFTCAEINWLVLKVLLYKTLVLRTVNCFVDIIFLKSSLGRLNNNHSTVVTAGS